MAGHASIEIEIHSPTICIVTLRGEQDAASSEAVTLALAAARGYDDILVDLASCTFIDSTLITVLLVAARRAQELGGALELVLPVEPNAVRRTLEIANVQMLLPFHASRAAAIVVAGARRRPSTTTRILRSAPPREVFARTGGTTVIRALVEPEGVSLGDRPGVRVDPACP